MIKKQTVKSDQTEMEIFSRNLGFDSETAKGLLKKIESWQKAKKYLLFLPATAETVRVHVGKLGSLANSVSCSIEVKWRNLSWRGRGHAHTIAQAFDGALSSLKVVAAKKALPVFQLNDVAA